ncbi:Gfo/Idh/MocA family protein [Halococcus agarilyticus]|uniref:Gfo/Idh/MocA family protein n=1 Tax=Halococcus agarilyticus TaxID=1232219 RepID=UPI000677C6F8|nr:Gfo/Idh/MocA family oxidoreductase [Halococcus agarilyticus]
MSDDHRIAVVGIGAAAEMHANAIESLDRATLVAGSCRAESKGETFAEAFDCAWYEDAATMLEGETPDVVTVCTPSGAHLSSVELAAEHGIDTLCEKPLEITTDRIDAMERIANEADVLLGGVFQQRFNPVVRAVHEAAAGGRFGDLAVANAHVPWWRDDDYYAPERWQGTRDLDGGGALMNQSIHAIDALCWLAGATMDLPRGENPVAEVSAYTARRAHDEDRLEVEDTAVAALEFENGALGQVLGATSMYPGSRRRLQLAGRDGTATVREDELRTWKFRDERESDADLRERFAGSETSGGAADPTDVDHDNHARNIEAFLDAREGDAPYPLDVTAARTAVAVIEAIYESADRGAPVVLD